MLDTAQKQQMAVALRKLLSDSFVLYFKTHSYHWNVTGPNFQSLHTTFEQQYTEMWQALDDIAERIRALGFYAPLNTGELLEHASMAEKQERPKAAAMLADLSASHQALLHEVIAPALELASELGDEASIDILTARISAHEKQAWMLNVMQEE